MFEWYFNYSVRKMRERSERKFNNGYKWGMRMLCLNAITTNQLVVMYGSRNTIKRMDDYGMGVLRAVADYRQIEEMSASKLDYIDQKIKAHLLV
jgi:hypothetical protein